MTFISGVWSSSTRVHVVDSRTIFTFKTPRKGSERLSLRDPNSTPCQQSPLTQKYSRSLLFNSCMCLQTLDPVKTESSRPTFGTGRKDCSNVYYDYDDRHLVWNSSRRNLELMYVYFTTGCQFSEWPGFTYPSFRITYFTRWLPP